MASQIPPTLFQDTQQRRGDLDVDDCILADLDRFASNHTECSEIGAVAYDVRRNRVREPPLHRHELVAAMVAVPELRKRLQGAVVESPPTLIDDGDHGTSGGLRNREPACDLGLGVLREDFQETAKRSGGEACVGVNEDQEIASVSLQDDIYCGRLAAPFRLSDQGDSGLESS